MPKYVAIFCGVDDLPSEKLPGLDAFARSNCRSARQLSREAMAFDYKGSEDEFFQQVHTKLGRTIPVIVLTVESARWAMPSQSIDDALKRFFDEA